MKRLLLALALCAPAFGQQAWNENDVEWTPPTVCADGQPIAACAIANYQIERAATATGSFTFVGTSTTTRFRHTVTAGGQSCYRIIAVGVSGASPPSTNTACKTNTAPTPPPPVPGPPTNVRFITAAVLNGMDKAPIYSVTAKGLGTTLYGFVPTGRSCDARVGRWRNLEWHKVSVRNPSTELWGVTVAQAAKMTFAAPCRAA